MRTGEEVQPARPGATAGTDPGAGTGAVGTAWRPVAAAGVGAFALTAEVSQGPVQPTWWVALDAALGVAAVLLLLHRHRHPVAVAAAVVAVSAFSAAAQGAVLVALVALATTRRWRAVAAVGAGFGAATVVDLLLLGEVTTPRVRADLVLAVLVWLACTATGAYLGSRRDLLTALRDRADAAERATAAERDQARTAERTRIARVLHDVLAHRISLVSMHAGVLAYRRDLPPEEQAATAEVVRDNANLALLELRQVLGVLREPAAGAGPDAPQPTLAAVDDLVADARAAGSDVALDLGDATRARLAQVPAAVGRHAYRVVQEAVTNARKHAAGAPVRVRVDVEQDRVVVEVRNGARPAGAPPAPPGSGMGLVGVDERVRQVGGRLEHGPDASGGYRLRAELPWGEEAG
ncbi:histidine kinase [Cellulomonas sp. GbtcB1]|uniref:sensor histidine kinase n=1 Tax=Cellulomonas sp. GbtcB1 TaxID=2824746 RepID=UPI001C2F8C86|nr:histidine kinase [Cellulomonas sp. GbtcB1]